MTLYEMFRITWIEKKNDLVGIFKTVALKIEMEGDMHKNVA